MTTTTRARHLAWAAPIALTTVLLAGCGNGTTEDAVTSSPDTDTTTATDDPQAREAEVADQVIDYSAREIEMRYENEELGEGAREFATYSWIDDRNADIAALRQGDRELDLIEATVVDHQVLAFNDTGEENGDVAPWTIILNLCIESRTDYREADGTVILDPDDVNQGAEEITARWDPDRDAYTLVSYQNGDTEACSFDTSSDNDATTEEP